MLLLANSKGKVPAMVQGRKSKVWLIGAFAVLACLLFLILRSPKEPSFQGKRLTKWLEASESDNQEIRKEAINAIQQIGSPALPFLTSGLTSRDHRIRMRLYSLYVRIVKRPKNALNRDFEYAKASFGFQALGELGVPTLRSLLLWHDWRVQQRAAGCLGQLGPQASEAVPDLISLLKSDAPLHVQTSVIMALGRIGSTPEINAALRESLHSRENHVKMYAALSLGRYDTSKSGVGDVVAFVTGTFRETNAASLGDIGPSARLAIPDLKLLANHSNSSVRNAAQFALKQIAPDEILPR